MAEVCPSFRGSGSSAACKKADRWSARRSPLSLARGRRLFVLGSRLNGGLRAWVGGLLSGWITGRLRHRILIRRRSTQCGALPAPQAQRHQTDDESWDESDRQSFPPSFDVWMRRMKSKDGTQFYQPRRSRLVVKTLFYIHLQTALLPKKVASSHFFRWIRTSQK